MKAVFDTNILVDDLNGISAADREMERYEEIAISIVIWMEVLAGADDAEEESITREFLSRFNLQRVKKTWRNARLKSGVSTRNTKGFSDKDIPRGRGKG